MEGEEREGKKIRSRKVEESVSQRRKSNLLSLSASSQS
jgi:hypothetical protein